MGRGAILLRWRIRHLMELFKLAETLASASPVGLFAIFIILLLKKKIVLPRELDYRDERIKQLEIEKIKYEDLVWQTLKIGEKAANLAENRNGPR